MSPSRSQTLPSQNHTLNSYLPPDHPETLVVLVWQNLEYFFGFRCLFVRLGVWNFASTRREPGNTRSIVIAVGIVTTVG
jgi:hypothetical protein